MTWRCTSSVACFGEMIDSVFRLTRSIDPFFLFFPFLFDRKEAEILNIARRRGSFSSALSSSILTNLG